MNNKSLNVENYLSIINDRLIQSGFDIRKNIDYKNQLFLCVAERTKFEIDRFGFCTTFFLFAELNNPDIHLLREFSAQSFCYAKRISGIHPPRGLLYGMLCFAVAITDSIDNETAKIIKEADSPKHWSASEKLVVFSLENKMLCYSETTPMWGSMYHDRDRQIIIEMLTP
jgi:hypothetical protein